MHDIQFLLSYLYGFLFHVRETWQRLKAAPQEVQEIEYFRTHFFWPLLGVGALCMFLLYGNGWFASSKLAYDDPFSFEYAMKGVVRFAVSYALSPMLATMLIRDFSSKLLGMSFKLEKLELYVTVCIAIDMMIVLACSFFPAFQFLRFGRLYVIAHVVLGSREIMEIEDSEFGLFCVDTYISIFGSIWVLEILVDMLQRI